MYPPRGLFLVDRPDARIPDQYQVVVELRAEAQWVNMIMIIAGIGLVAKTVIESLGFTVSCIAAPDAVAIAASAARSSARRLCDQPGREKIAMSMVLISSLP